MCGLCVGGWGDGEVGLRHFFPASYRDPVRLAKCTDSLTAMVLAFAPMETVLKWPRSVSIPFWTVPSVAEYPCPPPVPRKDML